MGGTVVLNLTRFLWWIRSCIKEDLNQCHLLEDIKFKKLPRWIGIVLVSIFLLPKTYCSILSTTQAESCIRDCVLVWLNCAHKLFIEMMALFCKTHIFSDIAMKDMAMVHPRAYAVFSKAVCHFGNVKMIPGIPQHEISVKHTVGLK